MVQNDAWSWMDGLEMKCLQMFEERNDATIRSSFLPVMSPPIAQPKTTTSTTSPNVNIHWPIGLKGQSGARFVLLLLLLFIVAMMIFYFLCLATLERELPATRIEQ
jgi:hypothetical protein